MFSCFGTFQICCWVDLVGNFVHFRCRPALHFSLNFSDPQRKCHHGNSELKRGRQLADNDEKRRWKRGRYPFIIRPPQRRLPDRPQTVVGRAVPAGLPISGLYLKLARQPRGVKRYFPMKRNNEPRAVVCAA